MDTTQTCSSKVCTGEFSGTCRPIKQENIPTCSSTNLCTNNGKCTVGITSSIYKTCVGEPSGSTWTIGNSNVDCICNNDSDESTTLDIYFWNNTSNNLSIVGPCEPVEGRASLSWVLLRKHFGRCVTARWLIPPPCTVAPGDFFFARSWSETHDDEEDCKRDALLNVCLTYGIDGKEDNSVTISMCRLRSGSGSSHCHRWHSVSYGTCQHSCSRGNLVLSTKNLTINGNPTRGSYQFIVTGGSVPEKCTQNPDNCPSGMYCSAPGLTCMSGCKINPESCKDGQICDANTRTCKAQTSCTTSKNCPPGEFCQSGFCANGCTPTSDNCGPGKICKDSVCVAGTSPTGPNGNGKKKLSTETIIIISMVVFIVVLFIIGFFIYFSQPTSKVTPGG